MAENWWKQVYAVLKKHWLIIAIIIVVLVVITVPTTFVLGMHNSTYDCSFQYTSYKDPLTEIAKKHVYYSAADKTVEIQLDQDFINSLVKDNISKMDLGLGDKVTVPEVMFSTKDKRIYINAKYGSINVPVSAQIDVKPTAAGLEITGSDIKLGRNNAPWFVKNRIPKEMLTYSVKYADLGLPQVFTVKSVSFGTGNIKAAVQLDPAKISDLVLEYYKKGVAGEVNNLKASQTGIIGTFINKVLSTGVLSDDKVKEYTVKALDNEELINSAIFFATAKDLDKYAKSVQDIQKGVADLMAPLQVIQYYGSVEETVNKILYDQKLKELLTWFIPPEQVDEYVTTVEGYYAYYGMYQDAVASLNESIDSVDRKGIDSQVKLVADYAKQVKDARESLISQIKKVDADKIEKLVVYLEKDEKIGKAYLTDIFAGDYDSVRGYLTDARGTKDFWLKNLNNANMKLADELPKVLNSRKTFTYDVLDSLKGQQYEQALNLISTDGVVDKRTQKYVDDLYAGIDFNALGVTQ